MGAGRTTPRPSDLYESLGVPATITSRRVRRLARTLRREPDCPLLDAACVAEHVLGDSKLRAEYDDVVARLRAANLPVPQIGRAIVVAPLPPRRGARVGRAIGGAAASAASAGATAAMVLGKVVLPLGFIGMVCAGILSPSHKTTSPSYEYKPPAYTPPVFQPDYSTSKLLDEQFQRELDAIRQRYSQPSLLLPRDRAKVDFSKLFPERDKTSPTFQRPDRSKGRSTAPAAPPAN
jgi:hypothetical protein